MGTTLISSGSSVDSQDFTYAPFAATLISGDTYVVAAYNGIPDATGYTPLVYGTTTSGTDTTVVDYGDYGDSNDPTTAPSPFFGSGINGNFQYEVPEPSNLAYLALGGAVLFFALRRQRAGNR